MFKWNKHILLKNGGWTGPVFAFEFKSVFPDSGVMTVLEITDLPGDLLRSVIINGHVFDVGGSHVIFSSNREILD